MNKDIKPENWVEYETTSGEPYKHLEPTKGDEIDMNRYNFVYIPDLGCQPQPAKDGDYVAFKDVQLREDYLEMLIQWMQRKSLSSEYTSSVYKISAWTDFYREYKYIAQEIEIWLKERHKQDNENKS
jgi:hypothetical protein